METSSVINLFILGSHCPVLVYFLMVYLFTAIKMHTKVQVEQLLLGVGADHSKFAVYIKGNMGIHLWFDVRPYWPRFKTFHVNSCERLTTVAAHLFSREQLNRIAKNSFHLAHNSHGRTNRAFAINENVKSLLSACGRAISLKYISSWYYMEEFQRRHLFPVQRRGKRCTRCNRHICLAQVV